MESFLFADGVRGLIVVSQAAWILLLVPPFLYFTFLIFWQGVEFERKKRELYGIWDMEFGTAWEGMGKGLYGKE